MDAYIEMCSKYINDVRERHRLGINVAQEQTSRAADSEMESSPSADFEGIRHVIVIPYRDFHKVVQDGETFSVENRWIVAQYEAGNMSFQEIGRELEAMRENCDLGDSVLLIRGVIEARYREYAPLLFRAAGLEYTELEARGSNYHSAYSDKDLPDQTQSLPTVINTSPTFREWELGQDTMAALIKKYDFGHAAKMRNETDYIIIPWYNQTGRDQGHYFLMGLALKRNFAFLIDSIYSTHAGEDAPSRYLWILHSLTFPDDMLNERRKS